MSEFFFIADRRDSHRGIIEFGETKPSRPFATIEVMTPARGAPLESRHGKPPVHRDGTGEVSGGVIFASWRRCAVQRS